MKIKIRNSKDFYAGLMFILFGLIAVGIAKSYPMGNATRMGSGYIPTILGGILILFGLITSVRALWLSGAPINPWPMRPLLLIPGSILAFGLIVEPLGLILAVLVLIVIGCLGGRQFRIYEVAVLYLALLALAIGVFTYIFEIPFNIWPKLWIF